MTNNIDSILKRLGVPAKFGPQVQAANFFATYPDGVFASFGSGSAVAGWDTFRVQFAGVGSRETARRFESMLFRAFRVEGFLRTSIDGLITLSFRCRVRSAIAGVFGRGGSSPSPDDFWGLKLKMPEGGTVILRKNGSPNAVSLEVSTDGTNWQPWELVGTDYSYTLQAGETLCIRNTSETFVALSTSNLNYWRFTFDSNTYASGSVMSLCVNDDSVESLSGSNDCFRGLFYNCSSLVAAPELPATTLGDRCYYSMFQNCTLLESAPSLPATTLVSSCYRNMFQGCTILSEIRTHMTDISASACLNNWLNSVSATGDFYCPASLTIPSGSSGIPNGWTRHDI